MNNITITDNPYNELTIVEKAEFISKLIIAAQHGYYGECAETVNLAQRNGLYALVKPISANAPEIKNDLDNPIDNKVNY